MNFEYFEKLSNEEAKKFFNDFLTIGAKEFEKLILILKEEKISLDYSMQSLFEVIDWAAKNMKTVPKEPDDKLPDWIKNTNDYKQGLYDFDHPSSVLLMTVAYYMGECFVKDDNGLSWGIGKPRTAEKNTPVITGFKSKMQLSVILVCENLIRRTIREKKNTHIQTAIDTWLSFKK